MNANLLCRCQVKRMMRKPEVQIENFGRRILTSDLGDICRSTGTNFTSEESKMMKRIVLVILFAALPVSLVFAQAGADKAPAKAPATKPASAGELQEQLMKMENDWAAAASKKDIDT